MVEDGDEFELRDGGHVGEVGCGVRDLRPGRSDELLERPRDDVLLLLRERLQLLVEVAPDDLVRASELLERGGAKHA